MTETCNTGQMDCKPSIVFENVRCFAIIVVGITTGFMCAVPVAFISIQQETVSRYWTYLVSAVGIRSVH